MRSLGSPFASAVAGVLLARMTTEFGRYALLSENDVKVVKAIGVGAAGGEPPRFGDLARPRRSVHRSARAAAKAR